MARWDTVVTSFASLPPGAWAAIVASSVALNIATWSAARRRIRRAGERAAAPNLLASKADKRRDTTLTVAAMLPAGLFWAMVMAGWYHGLAAFGRTTLGWRPTHRAARRVAPVNSERRMATSAGMGRFGRRSAA